MDFFEEPNWKWNSILRKCFARCIFLDTIASGSIRALQKNIRLLSANLEKQSSITRKRKPFLSWTDALFRAICIFRSHLPNAVANSSSTSVFSPLGTKYVSRGHEREKRIEKKKAWSLLIMPLSRKFSRVGQMHQFIEYNKAVSFFSWLEIRYNKMYTKRRSL